MATRNGRLYWALTAFPGGNALAAISADLHGDLMAPQSWRLSKACELPQILSTLKCAVTAAGARWHRPWDADTWLEPNVVNVNGHLRVLVRIVTGSFSTTNLAGVCEIDGEDEQFQIEFKQFHPLPGGQCKFFILYDEPSRLFWMLSNIPTDSQDLFGRHRATGGPGVRRGPGQ